MTRRLFCLLFVSLFVLKITAQNTMRLHLKDGHKQDIAIERIDSITFVEESTEQLETSLVGNWLWGSVDRGYYELLTINADRTYVGYDYYMEYGYDMQTYGTYKNNGFMLYLWSNGYGYQRRYTWFITSLTPNALEVMTQMGSFVYYRLQDKIISMTVDDDPILCEDGNRFVFADGVKVVIKDGKLYAKAVGTSYIQMYEADTGLIVAYKVIISDR